MLVFLLDEVIYMKGNAKVQVQVDKKRGTIRHLIYVPSQIVKALDIKKGNRIDFDIDNPLPDRIEEIAAGKNFKATTPKPQEHPGGEPYA